MSLLRVSETKKRKNLLAILKFRTKGLIPIDKLDEIVNKLNVNEQYMITPIIMDIAKPETIYVHYENESGNKTTRVRSEILYRSSNATLPTNEHESLLTDFKMITKILNPSEDYFVLTKHEYYFSNTQVTKTYYKIYIYLNKDAINIK